MSYLSPEVSLTVTGCVLRRIIASTSTTAEPRLFLVTKIGGLPDIIMMGCEKLYSLFKIHSCEDNTSSICTIDHFATSRF